MATLPALQSASSVCLCIVTATSTIAAAVQLPAHQRRGRPGSATVASKGATDEQQWAGSVAAARRRLAGAAAVAVSLLLLVAHGCAFESLRFHLNSEGSNNEHEYRQQLRQRRRPRAQQQRLTHPPSRGAALA
ncbi:hypothetical protein JKP88DRAFT_242082 [Tribonema minus]|uniref:Uncharacterized protein n=1 Tax=Tribonema minus TaxID=303371 RepID=A0A835YL59_9STRA|nr:hypothetical protein JKP88DRAFT_242082 [Tribonema minus]